MRRIACLALSCAAMLAQPALAQRQPERQSYDDRSSRDTPDIERQIRELEDSINAADREGRISPREADGYIRELREIETQLLDVRARTFGEPTAGDERRPSLAPTYQGRDTDEGQDDRWDSREPAPAPAPHDRSDESVDHL